MRHINWLYALLGMTSGIALGRHLTHHAEIEPFQSRQLPISQPERDQKLTIEDLLNMIEENGGAQIFKARIYAMLVCSRSIFTAQIYGFCCGELN